MDFDECARTLAALAERAQATAEHEGLAGGLRDARLAATDLRTLCNALHALLDISAFKLFATVPSVDYGLFKALWTLYLQLSLASAPKSPTDDDSRERGLRTLTRYFNGAVNDRSTAQSRRPFVPALSSLLLTGYALLGHWRLAGNVVRAVDHLSLTLPTAFLSDFAAHLSSADISRFHYWLGRYHLSVGNVEQAERMFAQIDLQALSLPVLRTVCGFRFLTRLVLHHRVPNRHIRETLPLPFRQLFHGLTQGSIHDFRAGLVRHQRFWLRHQLYFVLCKHVSHLVTRQLVRRTFLALAQSSLAADTSRLPLQTLCTACRLLTSPTTLVSADDAIDEEEMECLVANAIGYERPQLPMANATFGTSDGATAPASPSSANRADSVVGLLRGYVSHEKRTLVLSKRTPFPL